MVQDIESYQNIQNTLTLLKLMVQCEEDIKNNRFDS